MQIPHDQIAFSDNCVAFIDEWLQRYADNPVSPRPVISEAIDDTYFWGKMLSVITTLAAAPQPQALITWLTRHENLPFYDTKGDRFRFTRSGHKWQLIKFPPPAALSSIDEERNVA